MRTIYIFDIDITLANNDERAKLLVYHCIQCGSSCVHTGDHSWVCPVCGSTDVKIPQSAWDAFISPTDMANDKPIPQAQKFMKYLLKTGAEIHFITGRKENCRMVTEQWLSDHYCYDPNRSYLMMRDLEHDGIEASTYKEQAFQVLVKKIDADIKNDLFYFFEDDKFVFSVYENFGVVMQSPEVFVYMIPSGNPRSLERKFSR